MTSLRTPLVLCFIVAVSVQAQNAGTAVKSFRLDPSRPFVYLKFDHIGEGARVNDREPATRIWLRLVSNCNLPIVVLGGGKVEGGLEGEVFLNNEVKPNRQGGVVIFSTQTEPELPTIPTTLSVPGQHSNQGLSKRNASKTSEPTHGPAENNEARMPLGYPPSDVVSYETISPGANVLFSVPVNFVTREWHLEIGFRFGSENSQKSIPEQLSSVNPDVRGEVEMSVSYNFWDLPEEHRAEVETLNQNLPTKP